MTTRLKGLTVAFETNIREDDAQAIIDAIKMLRGVVAVAPVEVDGMQDWIIEERVKHRLWAGIHEVFADKKPKA